MITVKTLVAFSPIQEESKHLCFMSVMPRIGLAKETGDMSISLPHIGRAIRYHFFSHFCLRPGRRNGLEDQTYPAMVSLVHGEPLF